jgi:DNA-binding IclR family transcriptional regulator
VPTLQSSEKTLAEPQGGSSAHESSGGIRVLDRMAAILAVLECADGPVVLRDVAAGARLNKATTHRILQSLVRIRLVEPGPIPATYQLGIRAFQLGARVQQRLDIRLRALPHLHRLNAVTEQTTHLLIRDGWTAVCIERLEGISVSSLYLKLGGSLPLHIGAAPRVLLASLSHGELHEYLHHQLQLFTSHTLVQPSDLVADTMHTRQCGYALSEEDVTNGVCSIGAPVFSLDGAVAGAISIGGTSPRFSDQHRSELLGLVLQAARAITGDLGYPSGRPLPWQLAAR